VRGGEVSEPDGMLVAEDGHLHGARKSLHPPLRLLFRGPRPTGLARGG
jgi:hypothetical protein